MMTVMMRINCAQKAMRMYLSTANSLRAFRQLINGSTGLFAAGMHQRWSRQGQRERGIVPCMPQPVLPCILHGSCGSIDRPQVFNENGGMSLPQQRKRLPIYGNRNEFLCCDPHPCDPRSQRDKWLQVRAQNLFHCHFSWLDWLW